MPRPGSGRRRVVRDRLRDILVRKRPDPIPVSSTILRVRQRLPDNKSLERHNLLLDMGPMVVPSGSAASTPETQDELLG